MDMTVPAGLLTGRDTVRGLGGGDARVVMVENDPAFPHRVKVTISVEGAQRSVNLDRNRQLAVRRQTSVGVTPREDVYVAQAPGDRRMITTPV